MQIGFSSVAILAEANKPPRLSVSATPPSQQQWPTKVAMCGTNGRPVTAQCMVGGTTTPEVQQDGEATAAAAAPPGEVVKHRLPGMGKEEEGRVPVEVAAAAAAAGEVVKHRLPGKGKEEEEEAVAARPRQVSRLE